MNFLRILQFNETTNKRIRKISVASNGDNDNLVHYFAVNILKEVQGYI